MKPKIQLIILISISILFSSLISACSIMPKEEEVLAPPLKVPAKVEYTTLEIKKQNFERKIEVSAQYVSRTLYNLSFKNQSGKLKAVNVKLGDKVKKGQLLAEIITDNTKNQIEQQKIVLSKAKLATKNLKNKKLSDLADLKNEINSLKSKLNTMTMIEDEYPKKDIADLKTQIDNMNTKYKNTSDSYDTNIQMSIEDEKLNQLQLDNLTDNLANSQIVAPCDGEVSFITGTKPGAMVDIYETVVAVCDPNDLQLQYNGDDVNSFKLGMAVSIKSEKSEYPGKVVATPDSLPDDADSETNSSVWIKPNDKANAKIGGLAQITLVLEKKDNTIIIPKSLVQSVGTRKYVYVLENNIRKERDIETGIVTPSEIEVVRGLNVGDKLIQ